MRFLANENFPLKSIKVLQDSGHDVSAIAGASPGMKDQEVLNIAVNEERIILTFDRDYGELIYKRALPVPPGIVYFRFVPMSPEETGEYLIVLLSLPGLTWRGKFTVVERGRIRQRPLPRKNPTDF